LVDEVSRQGDRQMFSAVCSECGKECQVPFKPTGAKRFTVASVFEKEAAELIQEDPWRRQRRQTTSK